MKKEDKARFLFEEFGNIDDDLLYESSGRPLTVLKTKRKKRRRVVILAAAVVAVASILLVSTIAANRSGSAPTDDETPSSAPETYGQDPSTLHGLLPLDEQAQRDAIFGGKPVIFYTRGDEVYAQTIDVEDFTQLVSCVRSDTTPVQGARARRKVWVGDGKGRVFSPMLRFSKGNIAVGALFSYEQEIALSAQLERLLKTLTGLDF